MGRVVWADPAIKDLEEVMDFIAPDSPRYALQTGERIYEAAEKLGADEKQPPQIRSCAWATKTMRQL
jgi:plasmid stabilization system protein ParE